MKLQTVAVIGGGPGGLFAARLLKRSHPDASITVYEQAEPEQTFGFGVGIAAATQRNLDSADPESFAAVQRAAYPSHGATFEVAGSELRLEDASGLGIARNTLLAVLRDLALQAEVAIEYGTRVNAFELPADLVIAADGVGSTTRAALEEQVGSHAHTGRGYYLWCGTDFALETTLFSPVTTPDGTFITHAYPYAPGRSTFLIETDERTFHAAGFDATSAATPQGETDVAALAYLEEAFAHQLQGHRLIGNRTRWSQFRTIECDRWHHDNVVLLGDAVHTAHYSIGSGTKLAMEDAISLDTAILRESDLSSAFNRYQLERKPNVQRLQHAAARSESWWDSFDQRMDLPLPTLALSYMTRTGRLDLDRLDKQAPTLVDAALALMEDAPQTCGPANRALRTSVKFRDQLFSTREVARSEVESLSLVEVEVTLDDAWSTEADELATNLVTHDLGVEGFWIGGAPTRAALLTRFDFAERLRIAFPGTLVVTEVPASMREDAASAVASQRTHLVAWTEPPTPGA